MEMANMRKITYWLSTLGVASGLVGSGVQQLLRTEGEGALAPPYAWGIVQLGYPVYILTLLGVWKLLGAAAILLPRYPLLKEWAYAGLFFLFTGGMFSHVASGHVWYESLPALIFLALSIVSWHFRPADRRLLPRKADLDPAAASRRA
ncbi:DoxX family protein [Nonomuraea wenchangensis]